MGGNPNPPGDTPIDSVWVQPSDAQLILRARSVHDILETHPELQDEENSKIQFAAETRAWKERNEKNLAKKENTRKMASATGTGHAYKFAQRIESASSDSATPAPQHHLQEVVPLTNSSDHSDQSKVITSKGDVNGGGKKRTRTATETTELTETTGEASDYDDSVEILRLRGLLSFLLYSDNQELDKTRKLILGGDSGIDANLPIEIVRDDEDREIEQRRRNLRRLGRSGNWSSFVEDLTARFPMRHPVNLDAQDRLLIRIGDAKVRRNRNETEKRPAFNILKTKGTKEQSLLPNMKGKK